MNILFFVMMIAGHPMHGHMDILGDCGKAEKAFVDKFSSVDPVTGVPIASYIHTLCIKTEGGAAGG